jgi:pilus assembly protein CpaB
MSRRTIALVIAVVLAAVATIALVSYVQGVENKTTKNAQPVDVFVAKQTIPAGVTGDTAISQGLIQQITVPLKAKATGAIASLEEIKGKVASVDISQNEQILAQRFVAPGQIGSSLPIPVGRQAISVQVNIPPGVAGFIKQGDTVSVIAQLTVPKGSSSTTQQQTTPKVQYLLQDVSVLAVGQQVVVTGQEGKQQQQQTQVQNQVLLTLAVTPRQAEQLVYGTLQGQLYFTIVPKGQGPARTPGRTADNVFKS